MRTIARLAAAMALAGLLGGCASHVVDESQEDLGVPEMSATQAAMPLRVAVYVSPRIVKTSEWYTQNIYGNWWRMGDLGPDLLIAAQSYPGYAFDKAYLAPHFPNPAITSKSVDAVLVVEDTQPDARQVDPMNADGTSHLDSKLTLGVYTVTGTLITRYTAVAAIAIPTDNWRGGGDLESDARMVANAGTPELPAFRKALFHFPLQTVQAYLAAHGPEIAQEEASATPQFWQARKAAIDGQIAKSASLADHPNAREFVAEMRSYNEVAGVAAAVGTLGVAGLAAQGINPGFNMAVVNFENQMMKDNPTFVNTTQFVESTADLIPLARGKLPTCPDCR